MNGTISRDGKPLPAAPTALIRRLEWRARHAVNTSLSGNYRSAFKGRGMEFDQVVKYQWGDDLRDIDWKVTARLGEPYRKKFVEERDLSVMLIFEDSPALQFGSAGRTRRDTLLETAALLMMLSSVNRDRVMLLYGSPEGYWIQRALPGRRGILRLVAQLLGQEAPPLDGPAVCALPWTLARKAAARGSVLLWLGPFAQSPTPEPWQELQQRYQTVGVRADDPWDIELPVAGRLSVYDPLAGRLVSINTSSASERAAHARWRERRDAHFTRLFPRFDERLTICGTDDPLQALITYFRRHGRRGVYT